MRNTLISLVSILLITLTGCSSTSPYLEIGIGYTIDNNSDWYLRTDREWTCKYNDTFHAEAGMEFDNGWTLGYHHQSHVSCGGPWKARLPELYQDEIIITKKWGGRK